MVQKTDEGRNEGKGRMEGERLQRRRRKRAIDITEHIRPESCKKENNKERKNRRRTDRNCVEGKTYRNQ